jgi:hypothetical protein
VIGPQYMVLEDGSALLLIHFVYQAPPGVMRQQGVRLGPPAPDQWRVACTPRLPEADMSTGPKRQEVWHRSDDPRAVTCPLCKETEEFKRRMAFLDSMIGSPLQ